MSDGLRHLTLNYAARTGYPRPGVEIKETNMRRDILIHPG